MRKRPKYKQGFFKPHNPEKYIGDINNIVYRSWLEFKYMCFFDDNSAILKWSSEEVVIPYIDKGKNKKRRYFVDFYLKVKDRNNNITEYLIEIKPFSQVKPKKFSKGYTELDYITNLCKWDAAKQFAESRNMKFQIYTEKDI